MAAVVAKFAANKVLRGHMKKYEGMEVCGDNDPFFATIKGRDGKDQKVNRKIPDYIPAHDREVLAKAKIRAYKFDMGIKIKGIRFGWTSLIGLIPELGDLIDICMSVYIFYLCTRVKCRLPWLLKVRMMANILADFLVGLVPVIGDLLDTIFRCNTKNVALLDEYLNKEYGPENKEAKRLAGLELPDDYPMPVLNNPPPYQQHVMEPKRSQPVNTQGDKKYGWFSGGGKKARVPDVENGQTGMQETDMVMR